MANALHVLAAAAEHAAEGAAHAEPSAFGLTPVMWVALSMTTLILIALKVGVPKMLMSGLDASIAEIRKQLDEAKGLRAEAEALRKEYADKIANAEKDAAVMLEHAQSEANAIIAKAQTDATAMVARREKMADEKIGAAERAAVDELRARAAEAATRAARGLIKSNHSANADKSLVDEVIGAI